MKAQQTASQSLQMLEARNQILLLEKENNTMKRLLEQRGDDDDEGSTAGGRGDQQRRVDLVILKDGTNVTVDAAVKSEIHRMKRKINKAVRQVDRLKRRNTKLKTQFVKYARERQSSQPPMHPNQQPQPSMYPLDQQQAMQQQQANFEREPSVTGPPRPQQQKQPAAAAAASPAAHQVVIPQFGQAPPQGEEFHWSGHDATTHRRLSDNVVNQPIVYQDQLLQRQSTEEFDEFYQEGEEEEPGPPPAPVVVDRRVPGWTIQESPAEAWKRRKEEEKQRKAAGGRPPMAPGSQRGGGGPAPPGMRSAHGFSIPLPEKDAGVPEFMKRFQQIGMKGKEDVVECSGKVDTSSGGVRITKVGVILTGKALQAKEEAERTRKEEEEEAQQEEWYREGTAFAHVFVCFTFVFKSVVLLGCLSRYSPSQKFTKLISFHATMFCFLSLHIALSVSIFI